MSMDFNRKANDILLKLSDIYLEEDVSSDLAIGEKLIGKAILNRVVNIVYKNLKKRHDLLDFDTVFKLLYNENIEKAELCKNNIAKLCELMQSADFSFALINFIRLHKSNFSLHTLSLIHISEPTIPY